MEKSVKVSAKYIQKKTCWAKYNREKRKGFGKIHTNKNMLGKIQQRKKAFWAKYNGEKRKGFGKINTKKNMLGKIQWRKA